MSALFSLLAMIHILWIGASISWIWMWTRIGIRWWVAALTPVIVYMCAVALVRLT